MPVPHSPILNDKEQKDIHELSHKISLFRDNKIDEEKFRHFRLTRGVYGQRQTGVQMIRIKIPFGKISADQLTRLADTSDAYATGNLHITTRQNIQYHYVKLDDSPKVWQALSEAGITMREACGNTVRTITASATAGIDPHEPFDVTPYARAATDYFLRNPICQDMGRKVKITFSATDEDSAFTYFQDFGFLPKIQNDVRGFKVVVGGGLGAQSMVANKYSDFMETNKILPFLEAAIRVFDRHGERTNRNKARLKFLIKKIGFEEFKKLVEEELKSLAHSSIHIRTADEKIPALPVTNGNESITIEDKNAFELWKRTNVFEQKQQGFYGVYVRVKQGNLSSDAARRVAAIVNKFAADDIRLTINQGFLLKFVKPEFLPLVYNELKKIDLADPGFDSIADITSCPGTDTCNLGITNSTSLAQYLENIIQNEYADLIENSDIRIKMSGCMNSCGQHMGANIGFHGSSIKKEMRVIPAMILGLGGGVDPDGEGYIADKIIKVPTKRIPQLLRVLLDDYQENALENEHFNKYYRRLGKLYFSSLFEPLADTSQVEENEYMDWGAEMPYFPAIGVGECAGVSYDLVSVIIEDAKTRLESAAENFALKLYGDSIYLAYHAFIIAAKAMLLAKDIRCNTHLGILKDFQENYAGSEAFQEFNDFAERVLQINKIQPGEVFAEQYIEDAQRFLEIVFKEREAQLSSTKDTLVIDNYYKA